VPETEVLDFPLREVHNGFIMGSRPESRDGEAPNADKGKMSPPPQPFPRFLEIF
jgi:hypothetical protein